MPLWRLSLAGERVTSLALSPLGSPLGLARGGAEGPEGEGPKSERPEGEGQSSQAAAPASQALAAASYSGALFLFRRLAASAGWGPWEAVALAAAGGGPGGAAAKGAAAEEGSAEDGAEGLVGDGLAGGEAGKGSLGDCGGHVSWEPLGSGLLLDPGRGA